jgi:eukaryotic-like serine/threonine-protein kinase
MSEVDGRADLYALGAILYYMLTGTPPFEKPTPMALMIAHASEPVIPPSQRNPAVPADLEAVVMKCLAKNPTDRYPNTRALAADLGKCQCAADWNELQAEEWWLQQAESQFAAEEQQIQDAVTSSN